MDIGINIPLILALGAVVMPGVNYYKSFYGTVELKAWHARLACLIIAFIIVYLVTYKTVPFMWQEYVLTSGLVAFVASGYWDGTTQIGAAMAKALVKLDNK